MSPIFSALLPIILLIALGHQLRVRRWVDDAFWPGAERLTYYILFPALLLTSLAKARLGGVSAGGMAVAQGGSLLVMAGAMVVLSPWLMGPWTRMEGPGFTSLFQCVLRPNSYVGLGIAAGLWGSEGIALTAFCLAVVVPLVNLLCVLAMLRWAKREDAAAFRWRAVTGPIATNPLILSCLLGITLNLSGIGIPAAAEPLLAILGGASLPLGLLAVGAGLSLGAVRQAGFPVLLSLVLKMAVLPLMVWTGGRLAGLDGLALVVCVVFAALPPAPASYVLARQMGGDAALLSAMLSAQTLATAVVLPLWIMLVG